MSLEKSTTIDKVEFVGLHKTLCVRKATSILEDGVTISISYARESYDPKAVSELPSELQPYAEGVWTDEVIADFQDYLASLNEAAE